MSYECLLHFGSNRSSLRTGQSEQVRQQHAVLPSKLPLVAEEARVVILGNSSDLAADKLASDSTYACL